MKAIRRAALWFALLTKRLVKRPAYLAVLLLVPLFALALTIFSRQDSGVLHIALCVRDPGEPAAEAAVERLLAEDSIVRYERVRFPSEAREAVHSGRADAAWIFESDVSGQLQRYASLGKGLAVTVLEREDNVFLMLSREKLFAAIYPDLSFAVFSDFLEKDMKAGDRPEEELRGYYRSETVSERILRFTDADGSEVETKSYLVAPLRGILALLIVLSALASGMYCYREERSESFVWLSARKRRWLPLLCHVTAMLPTAIASLIAMALAGVTVDAGRELLLMLLYIPSAALFCELLRCLCPREEQFGALIPILTVAMLVFCPVFLDLDLLRPMRFVLPPAYYLRAVFSAAELPRLLLYGGVLLVLTDAASRLRQLRRGL
ncbi:MAG: ABC transporter permease [Oscillospiraceae bacterium]|nr:ABC transporter permease [Oscillospiraceae bacterium]